MTANLAKAKAEYEEQVFDLFEDLDPAPVLLRSAADYVCRLAAIGFHHRGEEDQQPWTLWTLSMPDRAWEAWATSTARDEGSGWRARLEHVWLARAGVLRRALVDIHTGLILQSRPGNQPAERQLP